MTTNTKLNLEFKPLEYLTWIHNAELPVNKHFQLSISYNNREGFWHVGDIDSYEVGIQIISDNLIPHRSLVLFEDTIGRNVFYNCSEADILNLVERAKTLEYAGEILVFDREEGQVKLDWVHRFYCAKGYDYESKMEYCLGIWGKEEVKFIPA